MVCLLFLTAALAAAQSLPGLDDFLETQRKEWKVPGLAVAVVKQDRVVHLGAYGTSDGERRSPVTTATLFGIGSITKSMTVSVLQTLAEEGKLDWDRPVRDFAPDFRLSDPRITEQATVRDLVTHRTGLPRHDAMWARTSATRAELFSRLRYLDFSAGFRQKYQYNNLMYVAAGVVAERVSGAAWEDLVRRRIFTPLKMNHANTTVGAPGDYAVENKMNIDSVGPAGSVNADIQEFARYLRMHMNFGELEGARILPEKRAREMQTAQMPIHETIYEDFGEPSYGMGFFLGQYAGRKVVYHTGTISNYHALLAFLPEERVGLVLLMNRVERAFPKMVSAHVFDSLLGRPARDWAARYRELAAKQAAERKPDTPVAGTNPSREFTAFAGTYSHPAYGAIRVAADRRIEWSGRSNTLEHYHYDVFRAKTEPGAVFSGLRMQFRSSADGQVDALCVPLEPAVEPIVFRRQP